MFYPLWSKSQNIYLHYLYLLIQISFMNFKNIKFVPITPQTLLMMFSIVFLKLFSTQFKLLSCDFDTLIPLFKIPFHFNSLTSCSPNIFIASFSDFFFFFCDSKRSSSLVYSHYFLYLVKSSSPMISNTMFMTIASKFVIEGHSS